MALWQVFNIFANRDYFWLSALKRVFTANLPNLFAAFGLAPVRSLDQGGSLHRALF